MYPRIHLTINFIDIKVFLCYNLLYQYYNRKILQKQVKIELYTLGNLFYEEKVY